MSTEIIDAHHLRVVPDGTIISWLRIPGDNTSEAVAFVRREVEYTAAVTDGPANVTVWISPGGWDPQTIESAGVTFPCRVVRWGDIGADTYIGAELPAVVETLDRGGQYNRAVALDAAAQVSAGTNVTDAMVLGTADLFLAWLNADDCGLGQ